MIEMPISSRFPIFLGLILILLCRGTVVFAEEGPLGFSLGGTDIRFFSSKRIYPQYIADPQRLTLGMERVWVSHNDIDLSGSDRYLLGAGGEASLADLHLPEDKRPMAQLSLFGGYQGLVDLKHFNDTIAWDGKYGCALSLQATDNLFLRAGMRHTSSHLGDHTEVTAGLSDNAYSRDEVFAASSLVYGRWRIYGEGGYGYSMYADFQKPWRVQGGIEYEAPTAFSSRGVGWYAAVDLSSLEERNWKFDRALQVGLEAKPYFTTWRLGFSFIHGRNPIGELVLKSEEYFGFGLSIDL
jgi:hypothetical protein